MTFFRAFQVIQAVIVTVAAILWARLGYHRRRPYWTRASWIRFAATFAVGLVALLIPVGVEFAIELGYAWRAGLSRDARTWYAIAAMALMAIGAGIAVIGLGWFAHGEPTRQFPGANAQSSARSV